MRIERVTTDLVRLAPPRPVASAGAQVSSLDYVMVRLDTDGGLVGVGYACIYAGREARALQALIEDLADLVTGEDVRFRGRAWHTLWRATGSMGHAGLSMAAISAYDLALWDLAGKVARLPV